MSKQISIGLLIYMHRINLQEYGSGQYKDITAVCITDCLVFMVSMKYQRNSRLTVFNRGEFIYISQPFSLILYIYIYL